MSELRVTDRDGVEHRLVARADATLMETLRDADLGIAAICGGMLSCGTCHVYLENTAEATGIAVPGEDEAALAAGLRHHVEGRSRIACQIPLDGVPDGLRITIAPEDVTAIESRWPARRLDHTFPEIDRMNQAREPATLADPDFYQNPYPVYDRLRAEAPVYLDPVIGLYVVTGAEEMKHILNNHQDFSSVPDVRVMAFYSNAPEILAIYEKEGGWAPMSTLVTTDPPDHRRYRALVEKAVGAASVRNLRENVGRAVNEFIDEFIDAGHVDMQAAVSMRLPVAVIGDLLGMPRDLGGVLQSMAESTTKLADGTRLTPEEIVEGHRAQIHGQKVFHEYLERYRKEPADNLLSHLLYARLDTGESLSEREIHSVIQALLVGGNDTTPGAIGNSLLLLARDPALQATLRADPKLIPAFAEESMRLESPVQGLYRRTLKEVTLGGVTIPENATITIRYAAANRDEKMFEKPDEMDLNRKGIRNHFAFGGGIHYCVGNMLARMELIVTVEEILRRLDAITLDPPDFVVRYVPKLVVRNPESLPMKFTKRA